MPTHSADAAALRLMHRQHGCARVSQLRALGLSHDQIAHRVARGIYERVSYGLVQLAGSGRGRHSNAMRGVMIAGEGAVACRWTAATLHGLDVPNVADVHVLIDAPRPRRPIDGVVIHRTRWLPSEHIVHVKRVPTTSVPRTVVDCATELDTWSALRMLDSTSPSPALWSRIHTAAEALSNGRPGVRMIAELTHPAGDERFRSTLERRASMALRANGVTQGEWNVLLHDARGPIREVDLCFREARLAVEFDGLRYHLQQSQAQLDRATDRRLQLLGFRVLRFTWRDVVERPDAVAREITVALSLA